MNSQDKAIMNLVIDFFNYHCNQRPERYEIKRCIVRPLGIAGIKTLSISIGLINDEGTMASIYCRPRKMFFIGKRGGIYTFNDKGKKQTHKYKSDLLSCVY